MQIAPIYTNIHEGIHTLNDNIYKLKLKLTLLTNKVGKTPSTKSMGL